MDARVEGMNCPIPEGRPTPPRTGSYSRRAVGASHGAERRARGGARLPRGLWTPRGSTTHRGSARARTTLGARNRLSRASPSALADLQAAAATAVRLRVLRWSLGEVRGRLVRRRAALSFSWDPPRESVAQSLRETLTAARDCYRSLTPP